MKVLVLGGYGLIGSAVALHLAARGHAVTGLGRDTGLARQQHPDLGWIDADISRLVRPGDWTGLLNDAAPECIVNCAGALQDGLRDNLGLLQTHAMVALYEAAEAAAVSRFVQISAPRASEDADTAFMRSKGIADKALMASALDWTILRPGLVLAPQAYGGTALLRAQAAIPWVQPLAIGDARVQTVFVADVAGAVEDVVSGRAPSRRVYDLVEDGDHALKDVVQSFRSWMGLPPAPTFSIPLRMMQAAARVADGLGWLGWRSPMRTTALRELAAGVIGDPGPWRASGGRPMRSLKETLRAMPAGAQDIWFSRSFLLKPIVVGALSFFWIATGLIALFNRDMAMAELTGRGMPAFVAAAVVVAGSIADIVLGAAILVRSWLRIAAWGMIALTAAYLIGGSVFAPDLWADPLGPLVKAIPAMVLAAIPLAWSRDR